jgi:COP9 signalosome complex subunit 7
MEQSKALNALEVPYSRFHNPLSILKLIYFQPFLALTKSATSPLAAADLITRATSAPNTFIFAELLQAPQIQNLSTSSSHANYLTLLKIFSYGTYTDYISTPTLPALNPAQTLKLRQLSFLTLARHPSDLTYEKLLGALGLETSRELEDLVISAIYAGLVSATLDPYHKRVAVSSVSPLRDLEPNSIPAMLTTLNLWSSRCVSTLADLEKQIASIKADAQKRFKEEQEWAAHVEKLVEGKDKEKEGGKEEKGAAVGGMFGFGRRLGGGVASKRGPEGDEGDDMDLDDEDDESGERRGGLRSAKKRGLASLGFGK